MEVLNRQQIFLVVQWATNNIGLYLSDTSVFQSIAVLPVTPQINYTQVLRDTANWVCICDTITATSAWEYLTIGNFYDDANTTVDTTCPGVWWESYYYLDDVSIVPVVVNETEDIFLNTVTFFQSGNNLTISNIENASTTISIYNLRGERILFQNAHSANNFVDIVLTDILSGIYFVEVMQGDRRQVLKLFLKNI